MQMTDMFNKLKDLQVILGKKYELEKKINEAPEQLDTQDDLLSRMRKEFIEKNHTYEETKENVLALRRELDEAVNSRETAEKKMDNITTHREYEALEKQISEATKKETEVRKELQKEEKSLTELNDTLKMTESMIKSQESDLDASRRSLDSQLDGYRAELSELERHENEIIPGLDQEVLFKFQRIIQRNSEGIVAVRGGVCTGCNMILPAQFANEVREGAEIQFCPYCSRILFHEDADDDGADSYFSGSGEMIDLDDDFIDDDDGDFIDEDDDDKEDELYDVSDSDDGDDDDDEDVSADDDDEDDAEDGEN